MTTLDWPTTSMFFQDVTGDGKLDGEDVRLIRKLTRELYRRTDLVEGQLELFVEEAAYG